ncbi:FixH family protein [Chengkuizengella sediminis]|uniref:FixH family protein n=1 Tax=Chengkuizengella sediminis TaxID=1885917 RepID=UPI0013896F1D|nr:FixH family protein [Chengkuizengella sediminis]NDI36150.1 FixH family protein [Chengkuizengella sediminis]
MRSLISILILLTIVLTGCSNGSSESETHIDMKSMDNPMEESLSPLQVELKTDSENVEVGSEVTFEAVVSQNNESVEDASEVKFEIRMNGKEESEMVQGQHQGDGVYSIQKTFNQEGIYTIISHVTARDMHNMPSLVLKVGQVEMSHSIDEGHSQSENPMDESTEGHTDQH